MFFYGQKKEALEPEKSFPHGVSGAVNRHVFRWRAGRRPLQVTPPIALTARVQTDLECIPFEPFLFVCGPSWHALCTRGLSYHKEIFHECKTYRHCCFVSPDLCGRCLRAVFVWFVRLVGTGQARLRATICQRQMQQHAGQCKGSL